MSNLKLYLDPFGFAELCDENDEVLWDAKEETDDEFLEAFGDYINEDDLDNVADWLEQYGLIKSDDEVELCIEYAEEETKQ